MNVVSIEAGIHILSTETRVPIVPVETKIVMGDIVEFQTNDMLDPHMMNENAQPVEQIP